MQRYTYYIPFAVIYLAFSLTMLLPYKVKIINGYTKKEYSPNKLICIFLIAISAVRLNTGSDYYNYYRIYNDINVYYQNVSGIFKDYGFQSGIHILSFYLKRIITLDTPLANNALFIVVAVFSYTLLFREIKKNSHDEKYSIVLYMLLGFYLMSNNILKQQISMILMMIAFDKLYEKKYIKYICLCVVAALFHETAIIPAVLFVVCLRVRIDKRFFYIMGFLALALTMALSYIGGFLEKIGIMGRYSGYIGDISLYAGDVRRTVGVITTLIAYLMIFLFVYKNKELINKYDNKTYTYVIMLIFGLVINIGAINMWVANRVAMYFYQFTIFLLPNCMKYLNLSKKKYNAMLIALSLFCIVFTIFYGENTYYSYHTIFNTEMIPMDLYKYILLYE